VGKLLRFILLFSFTVSPCFAIEFNDKIPHQVQTRIETILTLYNLNTLNDLKPFISQVEPLSEELVPRSKGYYRYEDHVILLAMNQLDEEIIKTFLHELGHGLILTFLKPLQLRAIANQFGNWNIDSSPHTLFSKVFQRPFFGPVVDPTAFPSTYSYANIHEWLAENIMETLLSTKKKTTKLSKFILNLIQTKFQELSHDSKSTVQR